MRILDGIRLSCRALKKWTNLGNFKERTKLLLRDTIPKGWFGELKALDHCTYTLELLITCNTIDVFSTRTKKEVQKHCSFFNGREVFFFK
jgi:hypothetical protein